MEEFREHNIKVPALPSHASHVLQPLDLVFFGAFKAAIPKGDSSLRQLALPERSFFDVEGDEITTSTTMTSSLESISIFYGSLLGQPRA
jgi:hypothetical protein